MELSQIILVLIMYVVIFQCWPIKNIWKSHLKVVYLAACFFLHRNVEKNELNILIKTCEKQNTS